MIYRIEETPTNEGTKVYEVGKTHGWIDNPSVVTSIEYDVFNANSSLPERVKVIFADGTSKSYPIGAVAICEADS